MLKWTSSTQRLHELTAANQPPEPAAGSITRAARHQRRQRRQRRATIANKENVPHGYSYSSTPMPLPTPMTMRVRNSPLVLAPLSDIRNVSPAASPSSSGRRIVQSERYATTLPRYEVEYSPTTSNLPNAQHLALRGLLPLDPFLEQPRYMAATQQLKQRRLEADFLATMEQQQPQQQQHQQQQQHPEPVKRPVTPQPSTQMGDQTLDKLIDAILDSACKANGTSGKKKPRKSFNLRRRTLVKQQLETQCSGAAMLSPSYAAGDDPASDLSFGLHPLLPATPEPASPLCHLPHSVLVQLPTPHTATAAAAAAGTHSDTFCLETPVRPLKRSRGREVESPLKRYKVDASNYFEVGLALPSSIYV